MTEMTMGSNLTLPVTSLRASLLWAGGPGVPDVDVSALLVADDGEVASDADFVFYNQPVHYSGGVRLAGKTAPPQASDSIDIDLAVLPTTTDRVVLVASADGGTFGQVPGLRLVLADPSGQPFASFAMTADTETAFVTAELYRRNGAWKARAIGQGYSSGLAGLAADFGIDTGASDEAGGAGESGAGAPVAATPPPPPAPVVAPPPPAPVVAPPPPAPVVAPLPPAAPASLDLDAPAAPAAAAPSSLDLEAPAAPVAAAPPSLDLEAPAAPAPPSLDLDAPAAPIATPPLTAPAPAAYPPAPAGFAPPAPAGYAPAEPAAPYLPPPVSAPATPVPPQPPVAAAEPEPPVPAPEPPAAPLAAPPPAAPAAAEPAASPAPAPVSLVKNQRAELAGLQRVVFSLGWVPAEGRSTVDLDASVIAFDAAAKKLAIVWYMHLNEFFGALQHTGDNRQGGYGSVEQILVDLTRLPVDVESLIFTINSFRGQTFTDIGQAYCAVQNGDDGTVLARYDLTDTQPSTALLMAELRRSGPGSWRVRAIGEFHDYRTVKKLVPSAARQVTLGA